MITALIIAIIFAFMALILYALVANSSRIEHEIEKEQMCKEAQRICNHECEGCAWNTKRSKR